MRMKTLAENALASADLLHMISYDRADMAYLPHAPAPNKTEKQPKRRKRGDYGQFTTTMGTQLP